MLSPALVCISYICHQDKENYVYFPSLYALKFHDKLFFVFHHLNYRACSSVLEGFLHFILNNYLIFLFLSLTFILALSSEC